VVTTLAANRRQAQERLAAADYWLDQDTGVALESSARRGDGWATAAQALGASMRITRGEP
jgi:hypothetical protein